MKTHIHFRSYLANFFVQSGMFQTKVVQKFETNCLCCTFVFPKSFRYWKILWSGGGHKWQYGACILYAVYLRLQTHTQNMQYSLLFHYSNGCTNAPQCHVILPLPVLFSTQFPSPMSLATKVVNKSNTDTKVRVLKAKKIVHYL